MLQLQVIGNLCKDAEMKQIGENWYAVCRIAVQTTKDETLFMNVLKRTRDGIPGLSTYLTKGRKIYAQGNIGISAYINAKGEAVADITLWADRIEFFSVVIAEEDAQAF